jgi:DNA-binding beta-propeller fold protein YncE
LHFTPDGRFGFTPERDQDSVAKINLATRRIVKRVDFPPGSKPYMLRVAPDGASLWVQTAGTNENVILDVESMRTLHTTATGKAPVQSAFAPANGRYALITHLDETFVLALDRASGQAVQRIDVGGSQANASFSPDGGMAFVTVTSRNEVAAIDMAELTVIGRVATGSEPMGLAILDPTTP